MADLEALKRATLKVPPWAAGEWEAHLDESTGAHEVRTRLDGDVDGDSGRHIVVGGDLVALISDALGDADLAELIALANPATILDLISRLEEAEKALEPFSATGEALSSGPRDEAVWAGQRPAPPITFGDLRRAHAAHKRLKGGIDEG